MRFLSVSGKKTPILVSPDAQLKYLKFGSGAFDSDLVRIAEELVSEDSIVWDIGANVGVFTFAAASIANKGTIVSVEADSWLASILRRSSQYRAYKDCDIRIISAAVSNRNEIAKFQIASRGRASNSLVDSGGRSTMGGVREVQYVPAVTLDSILKSQPVPDLVKIDVEGAEALVIAGAESLLRDARSLFYIEIGEECREQIREAFAGANYIAVYRAGESCEGASLNNLFFVPRENQELLGRIQRLCKEI